MKSDRFKFRRFTLEVKQKIALEVPLLEKVMASLGSFKLDSPQLAQCDPIILAGIWGLKTNLGFCIKHAGELAGIGEYYGDSRKMADRLLFSVNAVVDGLSALGECIPHIPLSEQEKQPLESAVFLGQQTTKRLKQLILP